MAQMLVNCIVGSQSVGKTGNGTLVLFDLDVGHELKITLQKAVVAEAVVSSKTPRQLMFDGVELRRSDNGLYLVAMACAPVEPSKK